MKSKTIEVGLTVEVSKFHFAKFTWTADFDPVEDRDFEDATHKLHQRLKDFISKELGH